MCKDTNTAINHHYCLILAGGRGRRLWPVSRDERPKQFLDLLGTGETLLQQTYRRMAAIMPASHVLVTTFAEYAAEVRRQLPGLPSWNLLCEPIRRNTAPIVAWATRRVEQRDRAAAIVITPSDQIITDDEAFRRDILDGLDHAARCGCFLVMGIRPVRPEPGYGYVQMGERHGEGIFTVRSFTEKPEREGARMFMESGEFLWNTGLFVASSRYLRERLMQLLPPVLRAFDERQGDKDEAQWVRDNYATYPNLSLESGILEPAQGVCVKECHFGWADIGTWHGLWEALASSPTDNVAPATRTQLSDTTGCVIALPSGRTAVINGLHDFIVVEQGDVLLITPRKDSSGEVVKMMTRYISER